MQSPKNAAGVNEVKVRSVVNVRLEQLVNRDANEVRAPSVVNVRLEQLVNRDVDVGRVPSVVDGRPEREVSVVPGGHSLVDAVVRAAQVVLCGCSQ